MDFVVTGTAVAENPVFLAEHFPVNASGKSCLSVLHNHNNKVSGKFPSCLSEVLYDQREPEGQAN